MDSTSGQDVSVSLACAHQLKANVCRTAEGLKHLRQELLRSLGADEPVQDRFLQVSDDIIDEHAVASRPSLVVFGPNSCGKTAFIQRFLDIGDILPSDIGSVTARIVQLTYAAGVQAHFRVYDTNEKQVVQVEGNLSSFFADEGQSDWEGVANALTPHVRRPDGIDEESREFTEWATCFVELAIPSNVLALGIDVYDTPGFLSGNRERVLTDNLHQLVKRIRPTLVFLYDNATISDTDKSCFLAMKNALGSMERVPVFFLNTKADCISIANDYALDDDPENVPLALFHTTLAQKRQKCYDLLLRRREMASEALGRLPDAVDECPCFDICTIPGEFDVWETHTALINTNTFRRIVRFAAQAYSIPSHRLARDLLATCDDYFDLLTSMALRTPAQLDGLREEAFEWGRRFFHEYRSSLPTLIDQLVANISKLFDELKVQIAGQAALLVRESDPIDVLLQDKSKTIGDYIQVAVREQIIKVAANDVIIDQRDRVATLIANHFERQRGQRKNELLARAQRLVLSELSAAVLQKADRVDSLLGNLFTLSLGFGRFWRSLPTRISAYQKDLYNRFVTGRIQSGDDDDSVYKLLDAMDAYATLSNEAGRRKLAEHYLKEIAEKIVAQKDTFNRNLTAWIAEQERSFVTTIDRTHKYIETHLPDQLKRYQTLSKLSGPFAKVECQLFAAVELDKRAGARPVIGEELGRGGFYIVHAAQWGADGNLAVKKLLQPRVEDDNMVALEAHLHRTATLLCAEHIVPLLHVHEHESTDGQREFWLVMPRYPMSLQRFLIRHMADLSFARVVSFALTIANALSDLHRLEIVHRDLKTSNVMLDGNERCFLIDFGTARFGSASRTMLGTAPLPPEMLATNPTRRSNPLSYDGTAADVYSFGLLLFEMLPKREYQRLDVDMLANLDEILRSNPKSDELTKPYEDLTRACLDPDPDRRPNAATLVTQLQAIQKQTEQKPCMVCEERLRAVRLMPCGHKATCAQCWEAWHRASTAGAPACIICKAPVTHHTQDDANATYFPGQ